MSKPRCFQGLCLRQQSHSSAAEDRGQRRLCVAVAPSCRAGWLRGRVGLGGGWDLGRGCSGNRAQRQEKSQRPGAGCKSSGPAVWHIYGYWGGCRESEEEAHVPLHDKSSGQLGKLLCPFMLRVLARRNADVTEFMMSGHLSGPKLGRSGQSPILSPTGSCPSISPVGDLFSLSSG